MSPSEPNQPGTEAAHGVDIAKTAAGGDDTGWNRPPPKIPEARPPSRRVEIRAEYSRRLEARAATLKRETMRERVVTELRLIVFAAGVIQGLLTFRWKLAAPGWLVVPVVVFVIVFVVQMRAEKRRRRASRAVAFYQQGLAHLDENWAGRGEQGLHFLDPEHPYAADLDLFGAGSLFERICWARTRVGEATLAGWLLHPAAPDEVRARQASVEELRNKLDLREALELLGTDVREGVDPELLAAWGSAPRAFSGPAVPIAAALLSAVAIATLIAWAFFDVILSPFLAALLAEVAFFRGVSARVSGVLKPLDEGAHDLALLGHLLERLEREVFVSPPLVQFHESLKSDAQPASRQLALLGRRIQLLDAEKNQLFMPFAALLLWRIQAAVAIDSWRARSGPAIAGWLAAVGRFEALSALAAYAYENPGDQFPQIVEGDGRFEAMALGHPLLPEASCVRNDIELGRKARVLVVSGSNMSGKSTLLRTVGTNAVLALAGATVRAQQLCLSPLSIGATLRIQDSLQAGRSRFFAEILRLRQIVDLSAGPWPLLFLLDEVLNGTNSHDRRAGAEALVRGLLKRGAIGLVTTHDLALAEIVDRLGTEAANVHFEDQFESGSLQFDYRMRPGVVRKSNALALMRSVGLEV